MKLQKFDGELESSKDTQRTMWPFEFKKKQKTVLLNLSEWKCRLVFKQRDSGMWDVGMCTSWMIQARPHWNISTTIRWISNEIRFRRSCSVILWHVKLRWRPWSTFNLLNISVLILSVWACYHSAQTQQSLTELLCTFNHFHCFSDNWLESPRSENAVKAAWHPVKSLITCKWSYTVSQQSLSETVLLFKSVCHWRVTSGDSPLPLSTDNK